MVSSTLELSEVWIYPLKSARGLSLPQAQLSPTGLQFDRRWMLVDEQGLFLSQRKVPAMARLEVHLGNVLGFSFGDQHLELSLPPYALPETPVQVWRSRVTAQVFASDINAWFSEALQTSCRLVYMPDSTYRRTHPSRAPGKRVSFADGYPYLLTHEASLADLNAQLVTPVPMNRFRPNLVVRGGEAFAEDHWHELRIGEQLFRNVKLCERCTIITLDQESGERDPAAQTEPLRTLARHHLVGGKAIFGQNLIALNSKDAPQGSLRCGDPVEILSLKEVKSAVK